MIEFELQVDSVMELFELFEFRTKLVEPMIVLVAHDTGTDLFDDLFVFFVVRALPGPLLVALAEFVD